MTTEQKRAALGMALVVAAGALTLWLLFTFVPFNGGCVDRYVSLGTDPAYTAKVCGVQP